MIQFEQHAVAFIDVCGFKSVVEEAVSSPKKLAELDALVKLLGGVVPLLDSGVDQSVVPVSCIPRHIYISDCLILGAPMKPAVSIPNYDGLAILVMRVIQIYQHLLDRGFLMRGGIDVGPVWHDSTNIVGPAYQNAYALEGRARAPRVILSKVAADAWFSGAQGQGNQMCIEYERQTMVDCLHTYYIPARFGGDISAAHQHYRHVIDLNLKAGLDFDVHAKWDWIHRYLLQHGV